MTTSGQLQKVSAPMEDESQSVTSRPINGLPNDGELTYLESFNAPADRARVDPGRPTEDLHCTPTAGGPMNNANWPPQDAVERAAARIVLILVGMGIEGEAAINASDEVATRALLAAFPNPPEDDAAWNVVDDHERAEGELREALADAEKQISYWKCRAEAAWGREDIEANLRIEHYCGAVPGTLATARTDAQRQGRVRPARR